jgi:hypothetical protein
MFVFGGSQSLMNQTNQVNNHNQTGGANADPSLGDRAIR